MLVLDFGLDECLLVPHGAVLASMLQEFAMSAALKNAAVMKNDDLIRPCDRRQTVAVNLSLPLYLMIGYSRLTQ